MTLSGPTDGSAASDEVLRNLVAGLIDGYGGHGPTDVLAAEVIRTVRGWDVRQKRPSGLDRTA